MAAARIKGVLSPVVTPFKRDLSPDVGRFIAHCKWLLSQDCGLAVFGTNSEANSMSAKERIGLLEAIVSAGVPTDRMMPGTGACSINEAAEVSAHATKLGVGGVLMLPPFYYKGVSDEGLYRNFSEVIERVGDELLEPRPRHLDHDDTDRSGVLLDRRAGAHQVAVAERAVDPAHRRPVLRARVDAGREHRELA